MAASPAPAAGGGRAWRASRHARSVPVSLVATCVQCREEVLEAEVLGDEEECALRDHLLAVHRQTLQPETLRRLLRHFVITGPTPLAV